jgi:hypothetical protein
VIRKDGAKEGDWARSSEERMENKQNANKRRVHSRVAACRVSSSAGVLSRIPKVSHCVPYFNIGRLCDRDQPCFVSADATTVHHPSGAAEGCTHAGPTHIFLAFCTRIYNQLTASLTPVLSAGQSCETDPPTQPVHSPATAVCEPTAARMSDWITATHPSSALAPMTSRLANLSSLAPPSSHPASSGL